MSDFEIDIFFSEDFIPRKSFWSHYIQILYRPEYFNASSEPVDAPFNYLSELVLFPGGSTVIVKVSLILFYMYKNRHSKSVSGKCDAVLFLAFLTCFTFQIH